MRLIYCLLLILPAILSPQSTSAQSFSAKEIQRWEKRAQNVTIIRDHMGIPHIYGKTDADAVFGLLYAQCEDDFQRVEMNYIEKLGRLAEVQGEKMLYEDLLIRLVIDSSDAIRDYAKAPSWLKELCQAFADGINFYLYKNPDTKPALLQRFQPWYPLLWTDGSIGAINTADIGVKELEAFYSQDTPLAAGRSVVKGEGGMEKREWRRENGEGRAEKAENPSTPINIASNLNMRELNTEIFEEPLPTGSNGFAIAPKLSSSGKAMLYINPHVSFYFRPEVHMVSEQGLNAYGAVTWGQFFVYQGFNENLGWMHTSCYVDAADTYIEKLEERKYGWTYHYDGKLKLVKTKEIKLRYKDGDQMKEKIIPAYFTHHGPIMTNRDGQFLSMRADNRLMEGLIQCWNRTKAKNIDEFKKTLDLRGNISNSTVYADKDGNIAYWHGNRIPKRDPSIDWTKPVDGSTSKTEWKGYHPISETVHQINPSNGWLQHCNSSPFFMSGDNSPKPADFPAYMAPDGDNFRGINAVRTLSEQKAAFDLDQLIRVGYDRRLAAFEELIPAMLMGFDKLNPGDTLYAWLAGPAAVLRQWDYKVDTSSIATTLAVEWGQKLLPFLMKLKDPDGKTLDMVQRVRTFIQQERTTEMLQSLYATVLDLQQRYGQWQMPWGRINRFQRISPAIENRFDDSQPSYPVAFASGTWGMLPSFNSRVYPGTTKRYGYNGNSFIAAVEFGDRIRAKGLLTGGQSGNPASPHFADQAEAYSLGRFRDLLFYKEDVQRHAERTYKPGE
jgi:acyl-homoserine-lactone acylase